MSFSKPESNLALLQNNNRETIQYVPAKRRSSLATIVFAAVIAALSLGFFGTESRAVDFPEARCPAQPSDDAFLPCGETFLMQPGVGSSLVPYRGQSLPSDGPLLDLLSEARSVRSENGLLESTFTLTSGTADNPMMVGSKPYKVITYSGPSRLGGVVTSYNSLFPNPTLIAEPGDTIRLNILDERLPEEKLQDTSQSWDPTHPVPKNSNIHYHGLLVSPTGNGDNVYRSFLPGGDYVSEINIPENHDRGVNWYHPHFHRSTATQVYGGLAGILQVGNVVDTDKRSVYGGFAQRILVLNGMALAESKKNAGMFEIGPTGIGTSPHFTDPDPSAAQGSPSDAPNYAPTYFVNGQVNPIIEMRPGETQVWTLANVSPFSAYSLGIFQIGSNGAVDPNGPLFKSVMIAQDGNDHFTPVRTYFTKQRDINKDTYVAPGERITWAITAPAEPGDYYLANVKDSAYTNLVSNLPAMLTFEPPASYVPSVIMATVRVKGEPVDTPAPTVEAEYPPEDFDAEPEVTRNISFDFDEHNLRGRINFGYFPDVAMPQSYSGDYERWVISTFSQVSHPFHIHQGQFVIEKIEYFEDQELTKLRTDLPQNPVINDVPRDIDTFAFPGRSKTYIKLKASNFVGKFVMHCHLLLHEDSGMMVTVRVLPPREASLTAIGAQSGNAPEVSLAHATTGQNAGSFMAYEESYKGGVDAEAGHMLGVEHIGRSEYKSHVVTAKRSGKPLIRVFDHKQNNAPLIEFVPFDGKGDGSSIALGDVDGDSVKEIIVGSGRGLEPRVALYKIKTSSDGSLKAEFLYDTPVLDETYKNAGVHVASGDVDGDNWDDIVVSNGPGSENRVMVMSGQLLSRGEKPEETVVLDDTGIIPGKQGLNITAENLAGGYFMYPPITNVGMNPPAPNPYRALIAVTPSVETENPAVTLFYYMGGGGHSHGPYAEHGVLRIVKEFTPFPGEKSPEDGLDITTALTLVADHNNPLVGLISSNGLKGQRVSYFKLSGDMETKPWATQTK
ncbi:MAG: multicopper oxidase domain-containing protein [Deltaproteobacteria bacterium]